MRGRCFAAGDAALGALLLRWLPTSAACAIPGTCAAAWQHAAWQHGCRASLFSTAARAAAVADDEEQSSWQTKFKKGIRNNDARMAQAALRRHLEAGGQAEPRHFNELIVLHGRCRQPHAAFSTLDTMVGLGLNPDPWTYGALLNACAKAAHPPYDLDPKWVARAEAVLADMKAVGLRPSAVHYNSLMDCQAKAGMLDAALSTYHAMLAEGEAPTRVTYNVLIHAAGRAGMPGTARRILEALMPRAGVTPDTVTWNSLLGAYAKAGDKDGVYEVWQRMHALYVAPDDVTERVLAEAFNSNPNLAAEMVAECREFRSLLGRISDLQRRGDPGLGELQRMGLMPEDLPARLQHFRRGGKSSGRKNEHQQRSIPLASRSGLFLPSGPDRPLLLDLHGMSQAAARMALLRWLGLIRALALGTGGADSTGGIPSAWAAAAGAGEEAGSGVSSPMAGGGEHQQPQQQQQWRRVAWRQQVDHAPVGADETNTGRAEEGATAQPTATAGTRSGEGGERLSIGGERLASGGNSGNGSDDTELLRVLRHRGGGSRGDSELLRVLCQRGLVVVAGSGRHSAKGRGGVLREVAAEVLRAEGLDFEEQESKPQRLPALPSSSYSSSSSSSPSPAAAAAAAPTASSSPAAAAAFPPPSVAWPSLAPPSPPAAAAGGGEAAGGAGAAAEGEQPPAAMPLEGMEAPPAGKPSGAAAVVQGTGRLHVPGPAVQRWLAAAERRERRSGLWHMLGVRGVLVGGGILGAAASMFVVPKLLQHIS